MDFKQLDAFVKVIELGSFSKAAEAIFLSQPSVSTYISSLEKDLGQALLNRSTKEVSPTLAGKIFYENAKELIALKHNAAERIKNLSGETSGTINIVASSVPSQYILPNILAGFCRLYPRISFNVKQLDTHDASKFIVAQRADVGILGGITNPDKCVYQEFMSERMVFIAPKTSIYTDKEYTIEELLHHRCFIGREEGSGTRSEYEAHFTKQGVDVSKIKTCISFDNTQSIINAVINGMGIAVVSEYAAKSFVAKGDICTIKLHPELPRRNFYYVLKKNFYHSHLVDLFIDYLKTNVRA